MSNCDMATNVHHNEPLISVVIPAVNEEQRLPRLLKAFERGKEAQIPFEVIVSDGGSTDTTRDIARQFGCTVVEANAGEKQTIAGGRNAGAVVAQGPIIVFINADTMPENIERLLFGVKEWFESSPSVAIAGPVNVDPSKTMWKDIVFHSFFNTYVRVLNGIGFAMGRGECQVVRRDIFERIGGYNATLAAGEDFDLYKRMRKYGRIGFRDAIAVYESPRRFRQKGYLRVFALWTLNGLSVLVRNKSASREWEQVR